MTARIAVALLPATWDAIIATLVAAGCDPSLDSDVAAAAWGQAELLRLETGRTGR